MALALVGGASQYTHAADTVEGEAGNFVWALTYIKTERSKRKVDDAQKYLVHHYQCVVKKGKEIVRTEKLISNGNWADGAIETEEARKNAADICYMLANKEASKA